MYFFCLSATSAISTIAVASACSMVVNREPATQVATNMDMANPTLIAGSDDALVIPDSPIGAPSGRCWPTNHTPDIYMGKRIVSAQA